VGSGTGAMAATRRTHASSTRRFVQRAASRLLICDHAVAARSRPDGSPESEQPVSSVSPDRNRGPTHDGGIRSSARPSSMEQRNRPDVQRATHPSTGPKTGGQRSYPQRGLDDTSPGVRCLSAKSAPVIVDTPAYLTDAFRSQGFSPSQRFDPTGALRLCFAPLPPIGFRPSELLPPGQPRGLSALCAPLPFNRSLRRSIGPTLASQPAPSVTPSAPAPTSKP
jgi:hypothetical protein